MHLPDLGPESSEMPITAVQVNIPQHLFDLTEPIAQTYNVGVEDVIARMLRLAFYMLDHDDLVYAVPNEDGQLYAVNGFDQLGE